MLLTEYDREKQRDALLCYDGSFKKDVQVRLLIKKDGTRWIALIQEPDVPFGTSFVREMISENEFSSRSINGKQINELLAEHYWE